MGFKYWKRPKLKIEQIDEIAHESKLAWALVAVLAARGYSSVDEIKAFIADAAELENPYVLKDMDKAVARITEAMEDGERICVFGDYDCDGVTATSLLTSYLQSVGADVIYYVPSREKEGYGLNNDAIKMLQGQKVDLIVTVDNGISAHKEIDYAKSLGIDVVVTDHHTPRETMPNAVAVINPHRADCPSAFKELAGVGVAFKLICALENAEPDELLEYYSDLVALGTVADVVALVGENRVIVKHGLQRLLENERPGIEALLEVSGLAGKDLTAESIAFGIIPRINAAGRMGAVDDVIELLLTDDANYAAESAETINEQNVLRKKAEEQIVLEIEEVLRKNPHILTKRVLVVFGKNWHHGVVGIVASKLMERYGKPSLLISIDGDTARGSGRSIDGFSLIDAITACQSHLTRFGGHTLAAGLTIPTAAIEAFDADIQAFARENYPFMPVATCNIDCILPTSKLLLENIASLSALEPFGAANEQPLFLLEKLTIDGIYPTTDKKHIRIKFSADSLQFYAVFFGMAEQNFPYFAGNIVDVVATITASEYNGKNQLSVKIRDLRPNSVPQDQILQGNELYSRHLRGEYDSSETAKLIADRDDLAVVYKYLRKSGGYQYDAVSLFYQIMDSKIEYSRMLVALDVMEELGLIARNGEKISTMPDPPKVNIDDSLILMNLKMKCR